LGDFDPIVAPGELGTNCAECGPLPARADMMTIVCASDGEIIATCSPGCMAELVAALAGGPGSQRRGGCIDDRSDATSHRG
jgi:hypothetical protein